MGDVNRGDACQPLQAPDFGAHADAQLRVKIGQRLIEKENLRLADQRPPQRDPLPLSARQGAGASVEQFPQLQRLRRLAHPRVDLRPANPLHAQREAEVLSHRHVRVERVILEHHRHAAVTGRQAGDVPVLKQDPTAADGLEPRDHPQERALAAARGPDQNQEFSVLDFQRDRPYSLDLAKALLHIEESERRHRNSPIDRKNQSPYYYSKNE